MTKKDKRSVALEFLKQLAGPEYVHLPKYISYVGMAVIIKDIIEKTEDVAATVSRAREKIVILPGGGVAFKKPSPTTTEDVQEFLDMPQSEFWQWLSAFTFSYLIVENFDALLALGGNLVGAVRLLAGL